MFKESSAFEVVDSHTGGEMTRVVTKGWPDIPGATMAERHAYVQKHHDYIRRALILEPRGGENYVGVVLTPPITPGAVAGCIYFAAKTFLTMCGHATIGTVVTLAHLGRIETPSSLASGGAGDDDASSSKQQQQPVVVKLDTPAGLITAELLNKNQVRITNVPCFVHTAGIPLTISTFAHHRQQDFKILVDLCYGGNWNAIVRDNNNNTSDSSSSVFPPCALSYENRHQLLNFADLVREALEEEKITDGDGKKINFVQFHSSPSPSAAANFGALSKNFVAFDCTFDRSPCGTGTSARAAQLRMLNRLKLDEEFNQESITGSIFTVSLAKCAAASGGDVDDKKAIPTVVATAHVVMTGTLICDPADTYCEGIS